MSDQNEIYLPSPGLCSSSNPNEMTMSYGMCGGASSEMQADDEIQSIADWFRSQLESSFGREFYEFTAETYTSQVVNGVNYSIKIRTGDQEWVKIEVYKPLECSGEAMTLNGYSAVC